MIRLEAWIRALATQQGKVPTTTMPTSTAPMPGESQSNRNGFANFGTLSLKAYWWIENRQIMAYKRFNRSATGANDPDTCKMIGKARLMKFYLCFYFSGYYRDGVPVYGFCKDSSGMVSLRTCHTCFAKRGVIWICCE